MQIGLQRAITANTKQRGKCDDEVLIVMNEHEEERARVSICGKQKCTRD